MENLNTIAEFGAVGALIIFFAWLLKSTLSQSKSLADMIHNHLAHILEAMQKNTEVLKNVSEGQKDLCDEIRKLKEKGQ